MNGYELYNIAKKHIGQGGSKARAYCNMTGGAWCNAYVCYIANEGGVKSLFFDGAKETYCPHSIKWCQSHLAQIPLYLAMPMDIIYFDWNNNRVPDHIGFVRNRIDTSVIYTHEGNTSGGIVDEKKRKAGYVLGIYRPHFKGSYDISKPLTVDGAFDYSSIAMLQKALGLKVDGILGKDTVKALQKKAGVTPDGAWGKNTSKAVQKMVGTTADGQFGINSVKALQKWINKQVQFKTDGKTTETVKKEETPTPSVPQPSKYDGALPSVRVTKTSSQVIADALKWGKWIANDNTYHYGEYGNKAYVTKSSKYYEGGKYAKIHNVTHRSGCHFCGTEERKKKKDARALGFNGENWEHTYVCNTFVTAMFAHGGMESTCLSKCRAGSCIGMNEKGRSGALDKSKNWTYKGKLAIKDLKAGDVLVSEPHMQCVYAPVSSSKVKIIEATSYIGKYGNSASKDSIRIKEKKPSYTSVYRFTGSVNEDIPIRHGEYSDRVTKWQNFLKWAGFDVGTVDGQFGDRTLSATKTFQYKTGLTVDGEVGSKSLAKAKEFKK